MIKIVALIKRRADLSHEAFCEYYEHRHSPLFARTIPDDVAAAITHYVQNHSVPVSALVDAPSLSGSWVEFEVAQEEGRLRLHVRPWERVLRRLVPAEPVLHVTPLELRDLLDPRT